MDSIDLLGVTVTTMATLSDHPQTTIYKNINKLELTPLKGVQTRTRYSIKDARKVLTQYVKKSAQVFNKMQAFYNFKGGVGKTTVCFQVASNLALLGFKVLVIDADPQGHLTMALRVKNITTANTLYDAIIGVKKIEDIILPVFDGLDCIPSNLSLSKADIALNGLPDRERQIGNLLKDIKSAYDFILFDTNPSISYLNRNIIACSDMINIIVETQAFPLYGLELIIEDINTFTARMNIPAPKILIIPNKYEERTTSSRDALEFLRANFKEYMRDSLVIHKSEDLSRANQISLPLVLRSKEQSRGFEDIAKATRVILSNSATLPPRSARRSRDKTPEE